MKTRFRLILSCLPVLAAVAPLPLSAAALQVTPTLTTNFGKTYENYRVLQKDPDGVYIKHANGMAKILFADLSEKDRTALGYDAGIEDAYVKERAAKREKLLGQAMELQKEWIKAQTAAAEADMMQMKMQDAAGQQGYAGAGVPMYDAGLPWLGSWGAGNPSGPFNNGPYGNGPYNNGPFNNGVGRQQMGQWGNGVGSCATGGRRGAWNTNGSCGPNGNLISRVPTNGCSNQGQIFHFRSFNTTSVPCRTNNVPFATPPLTGSVPALAPRATQTQHPAPIAGRIGVSGGGGRR
jgi:hypothetical protein